MKIMKSIRKKRQRKNSARVMYKAAKRELEIMAGAYGTLDPNTNDVISHVAKMNELAAGMKVLKQYC